MGHGKKKTVKRKGKVWKILDGTYKQKVKRDDVDRLIAAIQQELEWDKRDVATYMKITNGAIDWSGDVRSKRKPRKHIRKRS